ncbi:hypothetical protein GGI20_004237 [Coemansia sp. BCRC 34301]|nr:hypothetical protein GGI20_004237 [Coemansia sp. BCRC 34301]
MVGKLAIDIDRNCTILMYDRQIEYPVGQFDIVSDTYNTLKQKCVDEYGSEAKDLLDMTYIIPFFDMGVFRRLGDNEVIGSAIEFVDGEEAE